jgi:PleD family two-component response regulator
MKKNAKQNHSFGNSQKESNKENNYTNKKIIIWDEDVSEGTVLCDIFSRYGFNVFYCVWMDEFVSGVYKFKPDIIIVNTSHFSRSVFQIIQKVKKMLRRRVYVIYLFKDLCYLNKYDTIFVKKEGCIEKLISLISGIISEEKRKKLVRLDEKGEGA